MKKYIQAPCALLLLTTLIASTGCQTIQETSSKVSQKALSMVGLGDKEKIPEIDKKGVVDISKTTLEQIEKLTLNMPTGQWVYIENDLQGIYNLQNKAKDGHMLLMRLNCKNATQKGGFSLQNKDGQEILKSNDPQVGAIQVLLDNKNYSNPFDTVNIKKLDTFKAAVKKAKVIKIFNASKLYIFENGKAELLDKPVSCHP